MKIETPPQDAAATLNVADTPLTTILDLLAGEGSDDPDSVLARLPAEHLDRIATAAQRKGQDCLDLARCLVDCTAQLLMRLTPADACDRVLHLNLHLATLLDDHDRWDDLHTHADTAARIATGEPASPP
ncbi:hypothetical protein [Pseudoxanthomonas japonensis]|uniref:Uncharacterized protein n=1 Tax=Pseudoxanthomonas japonensis TaxID=69284 RepID=A0ABQ6ZDR0_9GAMM|nr:hypothetical protein [Pseudoxanthomonas japonensis]KAF1723444.1 hypothetical protein CSC78_16190 [Pseudoxanthomonas japonensis]